MWHITVFLSQKHSTKNGIIRPICSFILSVGLGLNDNVLIVVAVAVYAQAPTPRVPASESRVYKTFPRVLWHVSLVTHAQDPEQHLHLIQMCSVQCYGARSTTFSAAYVTGGVARGRATVNTN